MSDNSALRPASLNDFVGQERIKKALGPYIAQAHETCENLVNVLLTSEPGCGKTTLAELIAAAVEDPFSAIDLSRMNDRQFVSFIRRQRYGIIFVDEIHRAKPAQQEQLLTLMEEGYVSTSYGGRISCPCTSIIAATTEPHKVIPAVASRFGLRLEYDPYTDEEMAETVTRMAAALDLKISPSEAAALGMAAGGIPRSARDLVRAWEALGFQGEQTVEATLDLAQRQPDGLTNKHLEYLNVLYQLDGQAGERNLCSHLRVHASELLILERFLLRRQLIAIGPTGRSLTQAGDSRLRGNVVPTGRRKAHA